MKYVKFTIFNAFVLTFAYLGLVKEVQGFQNLFIFLMWFQFTIAFIIMLFNKEQRIKLYEATEKTRIPRKLAMSVAIIYPIILIWFACWFTLIACILDIFLTYTFLSMTKEDICKVQEDKESNEKIVF